MQKKTHLQGISTAVYNIASALPNPLKLRETLEDGTHPRSRGLRTDSHRSRGEISSWIAGWAALASWRGPDCGVDGVNSIVDPEPQRTAWLVLVPWRLVWLRDSATETPTDLAASKRSLAWLAPARRSRAF